MLLANELNVLFVKDYCIKANQLVYRIARMFGGDKVWRIASSKVVGEKAYSGL